MFFLFYEEKIEESVAKTTLTLGEESVFRERTGDRRRRYLGVALYPLPRSPQALVARDTLSA